MTTGVDRSGRRKGSLRPCKVTRANPPVTVINSRRSSSSNMRTTASGVKCSLLATYCPPLRAAPSRDVLGCSVARWLEHTPLSQRSSAPGTACFFFSVRTTLHQTSRASAQPKQASTATQQDSTRTDQRSVELRTVNGCGCRRDQQTRTHPIVR